ncbi:MAG: hypothetical protein KDK45_00100 [Leptospiraceae bacterium]|nr:hypothetical protein [Leptospiraceae bacterium]
MEKEVFTKPLSRIALINSYPKNLLGYQKRFKTTIGIINSFNTVNAGIFIFLAATTIFNDARVMVYYLVLSYLSIHLSGILINGFKTIFWICFLLFSISTTGLLLNNIGTLRELPTKIDSLRFQAPKFTNGDKNLWHRIQ